MNLKSFTREEIDNINKKAVGYEIKTLKDYPDNGCHLQAVLEFNIGMIVVYNIDSCILKYDVNKKSVLTSKNRWIVLATNDNMFKYNKEFYEIEDAVQYAYLTYERHINAIYSLEQYKVNKALEKRGYRRNTSVLDC